MKMLSLTMLALVLAGGWAMADGSGMVTAESTAAPQFSRFLVVDQVADQPTGPNASSDSDKTAPAESPSEKLSKSKGVIKPPPTGDHSVVKPPPTETTNKAVIAPPGTPGGDQAVQPK